MGLDDWRAIIAPWGMTDETLVHCRPASTIIERLGGLKAVAELTGAHPSRVTRWRLPKSQGGTGGVIPQRHIPALIEPARRVGLTAEDFMPVGTEAA